MFNKIFAYFKYRKIIKNNLEVIKSRYKLKYDNIYGRLYTVLNVTEERQEVLKTYGYEYLDNEVKKYISSLEEYFFTIGMLDLISISRIDSLDAVNVLIVLRYKYKGHQFILYLVSSIMIIFFSTALISGLYKLLLILINFIIGF